MSVTQQEQDPQLRDLLPTRDQFDRAITLQTIDFPALLSDGGLTYKPELNKATGSIIATILLLRAVHWWTKMKRRPIYKFKEPCEHPEYKPGDSWCEELGITAEMFDTALKKIGQKLNSKTERDPAAMIWYWTDVTRKTFYEINEAALAEACCMAYPSFTKQGDAGVSYTGQPGSDTLLGFTSKEQHSKNQSQIDPPTPAAAQSLKEKKQQEQLEQLQPYKDTAEKINQRIIDGYMDHGWTLVAKLKWEDTAKQLRLCHDREGTDPQEILNFYDWITGEDYHPSGNFHYLKILSSPLCWREPGGNKNPKIYNALDIFRERAPVEYTILNREQRKPASPLANVAPVARARTYGPTPDEINDAFNNDVPGPIKDEQ